jgi:hypothetical protein
MQNLTEPVRDLPEPTLDDAVRSLLAAIVDALTVPHADQPDDDQAEYALLRQRTDEARIIAASALRGLDPRYIADAAVQLRGWTAEAPVTYQVWQNRTTQAAGPEIADNGKITTGDSPARGEGQ